MTENPIIEPESIAAHKPMPAEGERGGAIADFDPELDPDRMESPARWESIFGLPGPLIVEIGPGKGRFLLARAAASPTTPCLGIEYAAKYLRIMKERAIKKGLRNVRVVRTEASSFISRFFPDACVRELHIYFPDPWPKRRHRKRRLLGPSFIEQAHRVLVAGGELYFATDFMEYFRETVELLKARFRIEEVAGPWPDSPAGRTNYEIKYMAEGRTIGRAIARKEP